MHHILLLATSPAVIHHPGLRVNSAAAYELMI
jgi:hypothetical protein